MHEFIYDMPTQKTLLLHFAETNESTNQDNETETSGLHLCSLINQVSLFGLLLTILLC